MTDVETPTSDRPLAGILVVALEQAVAAPVATCKLADAGARVIKLERHNGDFARTYDSAASGQSAYFAWSNRNKESLTVDIKDARDVALVKKICAAADVFVQNLAVGAAERAGLGSSELRRLNERLVTCDISGYGEQGEYADMKAYDLLVQAESGLVSISGEPRTQGRCGVSIVDIATGINAALAINEALIGRSSSGKGSAIKLSLFDVMADLMSVPLLQFEGGIEPKQAGLAHPSIAPYGGFDSSDGVTIVISVQNDREWHSFTHNVLKQPEIEKLPQFKDNPTRLENRDVVDTFVALFFAKRTKAELVKLLKDARIAYGVVNDMATFAEHQVLRRVCVQSETGSISMPAHPDANRDIGALDPQLPSIGEHNDAIRSEFP